MQKVVTVRMTSEQHATVKAAAGRRKLSMNEFCVKWLEYGIEMTFANEPVPVEEPKPEDGWLDIIRHCVGAGPDVLRSKRGYRNRYLVLVNSEAHAELRAMVERGLMDPGPYINNGRDQYFRATLKACKLIKLGKAATKRAMEGL